jgi:hypothetical protein
MKPALCLRLHATQSHPCFPAASNALALQVGNLIFAAAPTERITYNTLHFASKVVCQRDTLWKPYFVVVCSHTSSKMQNKRLQSAVKTTAGLTAYFVIAALFLLFDLRIYFLEIMLNAG